MDWYCYNDVRMTLVANLGGAYVWVINFDFSIISFGLKLQLDVETQDFGACEFLGLLLETGIGEGLLESYTLNKDRFLRGNKISLKDKAK